MNRTRHFQCYPQLLHKITKSYCGYFIIKLCIIYMSIYRCPPSQNPQKSYCMSLKLMEISWILIIIVSWSVLFRIKITYDYIRKAMQIESKICRKWMEKSPLPFMYCRNLPRLAAAFKIDLVDSMHRNTGHLNTVIIGKWEMVLGSRSYIKGMALLLRSVGYILVVGETRLKNFKSPFSSSKLEINIAFK